LLAALIAVFSYVMITNVGTRVNGLFSNVNSQLTTAS
jgi:Flp pilus assembly pilin Flp